MNEISKELINKWNNFLSDELTQTQKINYSKFFENIALYNRKDTKFLLSLGFRLLKEIPEIKITTRKKTSEKIHILDIEEESLYDAGIIIVDYVFPLINRCIKEIKSKLPSSFKISSIEIERSSNILSIILVL